MFYFRLGPKGNSLVNYTSICAKTDVLLILYMFYVIVFIKYYKVFIPFDSLADMLITYTCNSST